MTASAILLLGIAIAAALIYVPFGLVAYARLQVGTDLGAPRAGFDQLPDYAKRATWAHQNALETFMPFAAAALMAYVTQQASNVAIGAVAVFLLARLIYPKPNISDRTIG